MTCFISLIDCLITVWWFSDYYMKMYQGGCQWLFWMMGWSVKLTDGSCVNFLGLLRYCVLWSETLFFGLLMIIRRRGECGNINDQIFGHIETSGTCSTRVQTDLCIITILGHTVQYICPHVDINIMYRDQTHKLRTSAHSIYTILDRS